MTGSAILFAMKVSVIIPAYNEEKYITKALTAVSNLKTKPFEVIVVDNGSTDKTVELVKKFPNVRLISFTKIKGPNAARQAGFLASKGDIIATLDADCTPPPDWLTLGLAFLTAKKDIVAVTGSVDYTPKPYWWGPVLNELINHIFIPITSRTLELMDRGIMIGGNTLIKRGALTKIGGFNADITFHGDDTDTANRLVKHGKVRYSPKMTIPSSSRRLLSEGIAKTLKTYAEYAFMPKKSLKKKSGKVNHPR
jgi:glycosyltransferase involved in cell wall biosynthesis